MFLKLLTMIVDTKHFIIQIKSFGTIQYLSKIT